MPGCIEQQGESRSTCSPRNAPDWMGCQKSADRGVRADPAGVLGLDDLGGRGAVTAVASAARHAPARATRVKRSGSLPSTTSRGEGRRDT